MADDSVVPRPGLIQEILPQSINSTRDHCQRWYRCGWPTTDNQRSHADPESLHGAALVPSTSTERATLGSGGKHIGPDKNCSTPLSTRPLPPTSFLGPALTSQVPSLTFNTLSAALSWASTCPSF